jgi:hypothetical protein
MGNLQFDGPDAEACPFIGLAEDPATRFTFPHPDHRCRAGGRPSVVEYGHQGRACLTRDFVACDRYRAWMAPASKRHRPAAPELASQPVIHVFRAGDSLARIADLYGISVEQLVAANGLRTPDAVVDGQRLQIPLGRPPGSLADSGAPRRRSG